MLLSPLDYYHLVKPKTRHSKIYLSEDDLERALDSFQSLLVGSPSGSSRQDQVQEFPLPFVFSSLFWDCLGV